MTFWKVKRVTREGAQNWPQFNMGVNPDIFKRAAQKRPKFSVEENFNGVKHGHL